LFNLICLYIANTIVKSQLLVKLYLSKCNITIVDNKGTVVIFQKPCSRSLLVLIVDYRATCIQLHLRNSNTNLLSALYSNYERTALAFANKDIAFSI
jgi:hypothetical protein